MSKNKIFNRAFSLGSTFTLLFGGLLSLNSCNQDYYAKIKDSYFGEELKLALNEIISHTEQVNYASLARIYATSDASINSEIDPFTGYPKEIVLFYTGEVVTWSPWGQMGTSSNDINREHVWPQSRFKVYGEDVPGPYSDPHMVRPTLYSINVDRSNYFYAEEGNNVFDPAKIEGGDISYRGDIARILFYTATRYLELELVDLKSAPSSLNQMGCLSDLLKWNLEYPVLDREKQRNEAIYASSQANRNPFIDHPEYACRIWGNASDQTRTICGL